VDSLDNAQNAHPHTSPSRGAAHKAAPLPTDGLHNSSEVDVSVGLKEVVMFGKGVSRMRD